MFSSMLVHLYTHILCPAGLQVFLLTCTHISFALQGYKYSCTPIHTYPLPCRVTCILVHLYTNRLYPAWLQICLYTCKHISFARPGYKNACTPVNTYPLPDMITSMIVHLYTHILYPAGCSLLYSVMYCYDRYISVLYCTVL